MCYLLTFFFFPIPSIFKMAGPGFLSPSQAYGEYLEVSTTGSQALTSRSRSDIYIKSSVDIRSCLTISRKSVSFVNDSDDSFSRVGFVAATHGSIGPGVRRTGWSVDLSRVENATGFLFILSKFSGLILYYGLSLSSESLNFSFYCLSYL